LSQSSMVFSGDDHAFLLTVLRHDTQALADELGVKTIAFPLISAGIYGWPKDDAIACALETIGAYAGGVQSASLVAFDDETYARIADRLA